MGSTSLITEYDSALVLSSELEDLKVFSNDYPYFLFGIYVDSECIYSAKLWPASQTFSVYSFRNLIEEYLLSNKKPFAIFNCCFKFGNDTILESTLLVLYCSHRLPFRSTLIVSRFLTSLTSKRTYPHSTEYLSFLHGEEDNPGQIHCLYLDSDGNMESGILQFSVSQASDLGAATFGIKYDDLCKKLSEQGKDVSKLISYTVTMGERSMAFYVHNINPDTVFTFRNCFGAPETICLHGITTTKTTVERAMTESGTSRTFYDQSTEKIYEVETAPLSTDEAGWIEQLFMSYDVRVGVADDMSSLPQVLITESTCEISDANTGLNRVKFSWMYADGVPRLAYPHISDRIHSSAFTPHHN